MVKVRVPTVFSIVRASRGSIYRLSRISFIFYAFSRRAVSSGKKKETKRRTGLDKTRIARRGKKDRVNA